MTALKSSEEQNPQWPSLYKKSSLDGASGLSEKLTSSIQAAGGETAVG